MSVPLHYLLAATCAGLAAVAGWRGAQPPNPHRGPRLIPWRFIMVLAAAVAILAAGSGLRR